jgi:hypothetical protein
MVCKIHIKDFSLNFMEWDHPTFAGGDRQSLANQVAWSMFASLSMI